MANERFSKDFGIYVDVSLTNTPSWKLAICTKSITVNTTVGSVTINNNCTGNAENLLPSTVVNTIDFDGDTNSSPGVNEVSSDQLFTMAQNRVVSKWKIQTLDNTYVRYAAAAFIGTFTETASVPQYQTFSTSLNISGPLLTAVPS